VGFNGIMRSSTIGIKNMPSFFKGKFRVSVPANLSRKIYAIESSKPGGTKMELPLLNQSMIYFTKDLDRVIKEGSNYEELQWMTGQISSHYFWPPTSLGIFYRKSDVEPFKMIVAPLENIKQITAADLAIGVENSLAENVLASGKGAYVPDTSFEAYAEILQYPDNMIELIRLNQDFNGILIDVKAKGWKVSTLKENINPHSKCMFLFPLELNYSKIGLFAIGYEYLRYWGNFMPYSDIGLHYLMADTLKLATGNLLFPAEK